MHLKSIRNEVLLPFELFDNRVVDVDIIVMFSKVRKLN